MPVRDLPEDIVFLRLAGWYPLNDKDVVHWTISDYHPLHVKALNIVSGALKSLCEHIENNEMTPQPKISAKL